MFLFIESLRFIAPLVLSVSPFDCVFLSYFFFFSLLLLLPTLFLPFFSNVSFCWGWGGGKYWWSNCRVHLEFNIGRIFASIVGLESQVLLNLVCRYLGVDMRCSTWYCKLVSLDIGKFSFGWDE